MPILRGDRKHGAEGKPMTTKKSRVRFGHGFLFSSCPVGTGLPDVNMGEALSGVHAHAAPVRHETQSLPLTGTETMLQRVDL